MGKDVGAPLELLDGSGAQLWSASNFMTLRDGRLHEILEGAANGGAQAVILDALTGDDLSEIAGAGLRLTRPVVWAGTGGLVRALAARAFPERAARAPGRPLRIEAHRRGPILVVCGSASAVAREQVSRLKSAGVDGCRRRRRVAARCRPGGRAPLRGQRGGSPATRARPRRFVEYSGGDAGPSRRRSAGVGVVALRPDRRRAGGDGRRHRNGDAQVVGHDRRCASSVKRNRGSPSLLRPGRSQSSWRRRRGHSADPMPS